MVGVNGWAPMQYHAQNGFPGWLGGHDHKVCEFSELQGDA